MSLCLSIYLRTRNGVLEGTSISSNVSRGNQWFWDVLRFPNSKKKNTRKHTRTAAHGHPSLMGLHSLLSKRLSMYYSNCQNDGRVKPHYLGRILELLEFYLFPDCYSIDSSFLGDRFFNFRFLLWLSKRWPFSPWHLAILIDTQVALVFRVFLAKPNIKKAGPENPNCSERHNIFGPFAGWCNLALPPCSLRSSRSADSMLILPEIPKKYLVSKV